MYSPNESLKMVLADESAIVRAGVRRMLSETPEIEVVDELTDTQSTIASIRDLSPDLVMLDFYLDGGSAVDVLRECRSMRRRPICIVHTEQTDPSIRAISYAAGADIFYDKGSEPGPLVTMLRKLAATLLRDEIGLLQFSTTRR